MLYTLKVRPAGSTDGNKPEGKDNENVELEKSNILLMGPTGSGNFLNDWVLCWCSSPYRAIPEILGHEHFMKL